MEDIGGQTSPQCVQDDNHETAWSFCPQLELAADGRNRRARRDQTEKCRLSCSFRPTQKLEKRRKARSNPLPEANFVLH